MQRRSPDNRSSGSKQPGPSPLSPHPSSHHHAAPNLSTRMPDPRNEAPRQHLAGVRMTRAGRETAKWGHPNAHHRAPSSPAPDLAAQGQRCKASGAGQGGGRAGSRCSPAQLQPISGHPAARSDPTKIAANACDLRAAPHLTLTLLVLRLPAGLAPLVLRGRGGSGPGKGWGGTEEEESRQEKGGKKAAGQRTDRRRRGADPGLRGSGPRGAGRRRR